MNLHRIPLAVAAAALAIGTAACGSSSSGTTTTQPTAIATTTAAAAAGSSSSAAGTSATAAGTITIKDFGFGSPLTVKPGQTIKVVNEDSAPHTVTSDDGTSFDAPASPSGGTGSFTAPTKAGTYAFHCAVHPSMHGTLIVSG